MTEEEKKKKLNYLLSYTPKVMPANPTAQGWTESQIRLYQYKGYEILFGYYEQFSDDISKIVDDVKKRVDDFQNTIVNTIQVGEGLFKEGNTLSLDPEYIRKINVNYGDGLYKDETDNTLKLDYGEISKNVEADYDKLTNKPKINNVEVKGEHSEAYYGITAITDLELEALLD